MMEATTRRFLILCLALVALLIACSDDETASPTEPADPPPIPDQIDMYWEQFQYMKTVTAEMTQTKFDCIGIVLDSVAVIAGKPALTDLYEIRYYPDGHWWTFKADSFLSAYGLTFFVVDSIQFRYERGPVKYPDWDSLVSINSYGWYLPLDNPDGYSYIHQHLLMTMATPGADTVLATGEGDFNVIWFDADSPVSSRSGCELTLNYWLPEIELSYDLSVTWPGDPIGCAFDGYIWFEGGIRLVWQVADTLLNSNWDVYQIHSQDTVRFDVFDIAHDSAEHNFIETCE